MTDTREAFRFLQIFEAAVEEVGINSPDKVGMEVFSELRRCVVERVLAEMKKKEPSQRTPD